jgi:DNA repair exonuclease SbcCD ATPase subunit
MKINNIEWRNIASYGNKKQSLVFPDDASLFQLTGENGAGKSTIANAISFGLYGKIEGKKLGQIPNRINGHAWVKIEFENNNKVITVERGLEPSIFEITVNKIPYDQAGCRNVQEYLSEDLIGIPYYVFNNTISLSVNDFKSFLKMTPTDKRAIIDKIFGFSILNQMREILKGEVKKIKESLDILGGKLSSTRGMIGKSLTEMEILLRDIENESSVNTIKLTGDLNNFRKLKDIHSDKISDFKKIENEIKELVFSANLDLMEKRGILQELNRKMKVYESDICPTCNSELTGEFHEHIKDQLIIDNKFSSDELNELEKSLTLLKEKESLIGIQKIEITEKGNKIELKIREILRELEILNSNKNKSQVDSLERIIRKLEDDKIEIDSDVYKTTEKNSWIKTLDDVLGEKGVKQMAIRTILPSLNSEINELLLEMNLPHQVTFDEEFKATLYHMGMEIPMETLSTGEMKKADFVVLIAIMKLMKLKFSSINLLFLDELFSSVDPGGVSSILNILKSNSRKMGLNVFVINHAPMTHEIFDYRINIKKINGFSTMEFDDI